MNESQEHIEPQENGQETQPEPENGGAKEGEEEAVEYPLRAAAEDPRWALGVVWTWVGIAVALLVFFVVLILLGIWYD